MPIIKKNKFMVIFWFSWAIALCIVILLRYYANQPNKSMSVKTISAKAIGGYTFTNNGYVYHSFTATSTTFIVNEPIDVEIITVRYKKQ